MEMERKKGEEGDVISKMNERYPQMSKSHKAIAAYITNHYEQAVFMTAAKLGETVGTSESTVVRFAAGIGYDGYPKFQKALEEWVKDKAKFSSEDWGKIWEKLAIGDIDIRTGGGY